MLIGASREHEEPPDNLSRRVLPTSRSRSADIPPGGRVGSTRLQYVDHAALDHVAGLGGVCGHMRGCGMRLESLGAFPLLDDDKRVGAEFGLEIPDALRIDRWPVFDTAFLGMHRRHIGVELLQDRFAHAGFGGDDGDDMDHIGFLLRQCVRKCCGGGWSAMGGSLSPSHQSCPPPPMPRFSGHRASRARKSSNIAASLAQSNIRAYSARPSGHRALWTASGNARYRRPG